MRLYPADPAVPLRGPSGAAVDPIEGVEVDDLDVFWNRRLRDGDATTTRPAKPKASETKLSETKPAAKAD